MRTLLTSTSVIITNPVAPEPDQMPHGDIMIGVFGLAILISLFSRL